MTVSRRVLIIMGGAAAAVGVSGAKQSHAETAGLIAAASDLKFALPELARQFETETGHALTLTFGSSGVLATQIAKGAPFELFFSADEDLAQGLVDQGLTRDTGALYGLGRLSLYVPETSAVKADAGLEGVKAALAERKIWKFAIANPAHAPYGRAAREALQKVGLWAAITPLLVLGESATQTLQFATDGGADAALVPAPLVEAPGFAAKGRHVRLADALSAPLRQRMVLTKLAGPSAIAFAAFITSDNGRAILAKYGFSLPDRP